MRYLVAFMCVLALGVMGCSETAGTGGDGGSGGIGGAGGTARQGFPCTEQGIRDAIAEGGGPHTFDCGFPRTITPEAPIVIDNDVILDGGLLTIDGRRAAQTIINTEATAELRGFTITNTGRDGGCDPGCSAIFNRGSGTLVLTGTAVIDSSGVGIFNGGTLTANEATISGSGIGRLTGSRYGIQNIGDLALMASTVSGNAEEGIVNDGQGTATLTNSTVSGNGLNPSDDECEVLNNGGTVTLTNCTLWGTDGPAFCNGGNANESTARLMATIVSGECATGSGATTVSNGYNIEWPGDTCGFDQMSDRVNTTELNLIPLANFGGPTETHALLPGSVAIDVIPAVDCVDADGEPLVTDQRGVERPQGDTCDVGAVEMEATP